jgi:riboflavin transporter FmnP
VPSLAYKWKRTLKTAVIGLVIGVIFMTGAMVLWNYLVTPIYMHVPRSVVVGMLPTVFLPFNLVKGTVNAVFTVVLYKPLVKALRKISIIDERTKRSKPISVAKLEARTPKKIIRINLNEYINGKH